MMPVHSRFALAFIFSDVTHVTDVTALMGAACSGYVRFSGDVTDVTKPAHRHGFTGRVLPVRSAFTLAFVFSDVTHVTDVTALMGAACSGYVRFSGDVTDVTKPAHRHSFTRRLTALARPVHAEKTTSNNGFSAPRKLCGFFVPAILADGLLTHHQEGHDTTPVSRIGGQRLTRRDKSMFFHGTNKPGRLLAVVDAVARLPYPLGRGFGFDPIDYGATPR